SRGMASRKFVRLFGENHWAAPGQADVLVSGDDLHFRLISKLVRPHSGSWHDRMGTADSTGLRGGATAIPRRECRPEPAARHVYYLFRLLDRLGVAGSRPHRIREGIVCAKR